MRFAVPGFTVCFTTEGSCQKERIPPIIPVIPIEIPYRIVTPEWEWKDGKCGADVIDFAPFGDERKTDIKSVAGAIIAGQSGAQSFCPS
jgi:hypothetical protein